jgi:pimeloyl-ACP methyl ester carboxylesterase
MSSERQPQGERALRRIGVTARNKKHTLSYFDRGHSDHAAIVYVHGLGCSKRDFAGMCNEAALDGFRLLAYDHPGCGQSPASVDFPDSIDVLAEILEGFVAELDLRNFLLVGGSLGGLVSLLFAERHPDLITGFVNVEGNLASEDCLFSRKVVPHSFSDFEGQVFPAIKNGLARQPGQGFLKHLNALDEANSRSYYAYSFQTITYSDGGGLIDRFLSLPVPIFYFYGSENSALSYLPKLRESRCKMVEFDSADHFLFYDTPQEYARELQRCATLCGDLRQLS